MVPVQASLRHILDRRDSLRLAVDTLAPTRFAFLGYYALIRDVCKQFAVGPGMPTGAIALGVPCSGARGKFSVSFPVFVAHSDLQQNEQVRRNATGSRAGCLTHSFRKSTVGLVLNQLCSQACAVPSRVGDAVTRALVEARADTWIRIEAPLQTLGIPKESSSCSTHGGPGTATYVHPIVVDGQVCAAFGIDVMSTTLTRSEHRKMRTLLRSLGQTIQDLYWSYYSHLDQPDKTVVTSSNTEWESAGRVLGRPYLERLKKVISSEKGRSVMGAQQGLVFYCDGNGVKQVNDTCGSHAVGNEVIRAFGAVLWTGVQALSVRAQDAARCTGGIVTRWGGDEFIVVVGAEGTCGAMDKLATRFLQVVRGRMESAVRELASRAKEPTVGTLLKQTVGISMGFATWDCQDGLDEAIRGAERAMYVSKACGKLVRDLKRKEAHNIPTRIIRACLASKVNSTRVLKQLGLLIGVSDKLLCSPRKTTAV